MFLRLCLLRSFRTCWTGKVNYSSVPDELTFFKNDMIVCWHREPKFPYDCSKPLPEMQPESKSVLKVTTNEAYKLFNKEEPRPIIAEEMAKMTYTTKHIWFPRARDKKKMRMEPDRPYL
ncbi:hypothetical protein PV325_004144 [Microctonus aethiopoides]|uniref:Large ribosomal subunit protein mL42 n=1 Tax=Microctonus aethiopoides TaxID=144406 RepID=A0AA39EYL6_9HYME|nr:hypothetical protein PV325_004144 [Microctonus aethiopoides]KAK0097716.1 hypothetical protein PV326_014244 [Microctonus aethiopoides]KAK0158115.1 hypothetical protein PV328_009160 [Microctonus aethiopoides]